MLYKYCKEKKSKNPNQPIHTTAMCKNKWNTLSLYFFFWLFWYEGLLFWQNIILNPNIYGILNDKSK